MFKSPLYVSFPTPLYLLPASKVIINNYRQRGWEATLQVFANKRKEIK